VFPFPSQKEVYKQNPATTTFTGCSKAQGFVKAVYQAQDVHNANDSEIARLLLARLAS
jgi:hypothetical protein